MDWNAVTPAIIGLVGVALGAYLSARHHRVERRHNVIQLQLDRFYSPLLGKREQIEAKGALRVKVRSAANAAWQELCSRVRQGSRDNPLAEADAFRKLEAERFPAFEKIIEYNNRQLAEELLPLYREMVEFFAANMWLAEPSTRRHFTTLVQFLEIWNRHLDKSLPGEVALELERRGETSEQKLYPLYEELRVQVDRLREELKESLGFLSRMSRWLSAGNEPATRGKNG